MKNIKTLYSLTLVFVLSSIFLNAQQLQKSEIVVEVNETKEEEEKKKKFDIKIQGDSRRTIINRASVGIYGLRIGKSINKKTELGIGIYSSNLFGILGKAVLKNYEDDTKNPIEILPAEVDFHYFSFYGEYLIVNNDRLMFTANSQFGLGWVNVNFIESNPAKNSMQENKSIVEHSLKVNVKTFDWLRLIGGIGYRYLLTGKPQVKSAFNAPIYIIGFSADTKLLFKKIFKKNEKRTYL